MPFSPIVVGSNTFNQSGTGKYMLSTVTFGQPGNWFTIKGGSKTKDGSLTSCAVSRNLEKDVVVNGVTKRYNASVQLIIQVPHTGFTSTEIDTLAADISTFVTGPILDRILNGES